MSIGKSTFLVLLNFGTELRAMCTVVQVYDTKIELEM
jgi:hypothetical protein